jgi:virulence-associated protein VapD
MFAIAFDLDRGAADTLHPRQNRGAYAEIREKLEPHGFKRIQGSTYASDHDDQRRLYSAISALHHLEWLGPCLKNIRMFRMEHGADFTDVLKKPRA